MLQVPNNYETDLIYPIIERAAQLAGVNYATANDNTKLYLKVNVAILLVTSFLRISMLIFCNSVMYVHWLELTPIQYKSVCAACVCCVGGGGEVITRA